MIELNLQFFGGRGASAPGGIPNGGNSESRWSNGLGTRIETDPVKALGPQGKAKGVEDATLRTNPNHSREYSEYSENCQRCVVAYEARRRGYDVTAQPTYQGDTAPINGEWRRRFFVGAKEDHVGSRSEKKTLSNIEAKMAEYGEGSRVIVRVGWKAGGGHVFMAERRNGKTIYRDPQVGLRYDKKTLLKNVRTDTVSLTRVDNLSFSDKIGEAVTTGR